MARCIRFGCFSLRHGASGAAWWFLAVISFWADAGLLGLVLPRAQLSHLLGFGQLIPLSQWASSWLIAGWMVALMVAIVSRVRG